MTTLRVFIVALALAITMPVRAAETELRLEPDPPLAGAAVQVEVARELSRTGRELLLRDPHTQRELARFRFGRFPPARLRFDVPVDAQALVLELREGDVVIARQPASGFFPVETAARGLAVTPAAEDSETCAALPPRARPALALWLAACPLEQAPLVGRDLRAVDLSERNLRRADLRDSDLSDADLRHAELSGASLAGARLDGADLSGASLALADLQGASLFVADLDAADLRNADLRDADLSHASLSNADLNGARLGGATLDGVDFTGAICPDGSRATDSCRDHLELP